MRLFLSVIFLCALTAASDQIVYKLQNSVDSNVEDSIFKQYCGPVERLSTQIPHPNYDDLLIRSAAENLNGVAPVSFYMYSGVIQSYGFKKGRRADFPRDIYKDMVLSDFNTEYGMVQNFDEGTSRFDEDALWSKFDYEFESTVAENQAPQDIRGNTHAFLTYLCGEFRDRPTMIEEKLYWIANTIKLPVAEQQPIEPSKDIKNIWSLMSASSYQPYIELSRDIFYKKKQAVGAAHGSSSGKMTLSDKWQTDIPVPAFTVCEVKYMITEFVDIRRPNPGYKIYADQLYGEGRSEKDAAADSYWMTYCSQDDRDHYYDFRGDSNFKPNSPESNGMIWYATSMLNRCGRDAESGKVYIKSAKNAEGEWEKVNFPLDQCVEYMEKPFTKRWDATRAGLATWILRGTQFDDMFSDSYHSVMIHPSFSPELYPFGFTLEDGETRLGSDLSNFLPEFKNNFSLYWQQGDLGFNEIFGVSPQGVSQIDLAYERLQAAVDRHTDWYNSGYDDSNLEPQRARVTSQAYSPFVASSYEMSESDNFTAPGTTVQGPNDGRRHWMFVFKVHRDHWYSTQDLKNGKSVDFDHQWFDETSFGTTSLADAEKAWDRLGTPLEGELNTIIYLHNIWNMSHPSESFSEFPGISDDGFGEVRPNF